MNLLLFKNIILKYREEEICQDNLVLLIRAGMMLTYFRIWRDFISSRYSGFENNDAIVNHYMLKRIC